MEVAPETTREAIAGGKTVPTGRVRFRMNYRTDFDHTARFQYGGVNYDIVSITEIGRGEGLDVIGKRP